MWLNMQNKSLPSIGQEVQVESCGDEEEEGCCDDYFSKHPVTIRNCGAFYIYHLKPVPLGCSAYCVEEAKK
jgi:hypothetical protein